MSYAPWLAASGFLLGDDFPLPLDRPFTGASAARCGVSRRELQAMLADGVLRRVLRGVYAATQAPDSVRFRAAAIGLVVSPYAVVTDRAAAWVHGMPILKRGAHVAAPPIEVCHTVDTRSRRPEVEGHRRGLLLRDTMTIEGVRFTTPLRTALDLGRLLWRFDALAALDAGLRIGVDHESLLTEIERFRGHRGVRQLRALAPLADGRAESPGESALRLHWYDACLPPPEPQYWIYDDRGVGIYRLDLAAPEVRYAAEYDGEQFHSSGDYQGHDRERRGWLRDERQWQVDAFTKVDVYRPGTDICDRLRERFGEARRSVSIWSP